MTPDERPRAAVIASTDLLPMVEAHDYRGGIVCRSHYDVIADDQVCRVQILDADERVSMTPEFVHHVGRLPYSPRIVVLRDEIDGREIYYRQAGWYYGGNGSVVCAFERLHVTDL